MSRTRSSFTTTVQGEFAVLVDLDGEVSITNDAEAVVALVFEKTRCKRIIYRDTQGQWDELKFEPVHGAPASFRGFAAVDAKLATELNLHAR